MDAPSLDVEEPGYAVAWTAAIRRRNARLAEHRLYAVVNAFGRMTLRCDCESVFADLRAVWTHLEIIRDTEPKTR